MVNIEKGKGIWLTRHLRGNLLAGILVIVPAGLAAFVIFWLFVSVDNILQPIIQAVTGRDIVGLGFALAVIVVFLVGLMARNIIGKRIVQFGETVMARIPLARQIYQGTKQTMTSLSGLGSKAAFRDVVLIEFPRQGMKTIGFVTNEMKDKKGKKLLAVYVPTAPIPTSGFFQIVSEDMVIPTDISVDQAIQMVISSGMVSPETIDLGD